VSSESGGVLIVGAGPTGLLTALGLSRLGVPVTVVEAEAEIVPSPRAMVYHWSALEFLDRLGVLDDARDQGFTKQDYRYLRLDTGQQLDWSLDVIEAETPYAYNVHLGQEKLSAIVLSHLERQPNAEVVWSSPVDAVTQDREGVSVLAEGPDGPTELRGAWCVAADGARSTVRRQLGLAFEGMSWPERFVATNIRYDFHQHGFAIANMISDTVHGAILSKIDMTNLWRWTYCEDPSLAEDGILDRLRPNLEATVPDLGEFELERAQPYSMHQRAAERLRVGRILLAGDAAHATNPTGGLGLTSGLFDAEALIPILAEVMDGGPEEPLDTWAEERRRKFVEMASPAASENKRMLYSELDPKRRDEDFERMRAGTQDPDALRKRLMFLEELRSDAVLAAR